jgi:hypothetical protein
VALKAGWALADRLDRFSVTHIWRSWWNVDYIAGLNPIYFRLPALNNDQARYALVGELWKN